MLGIFSKLTGFFEAEVQSGLKRKRFFCVCFFFFPRHTIAEGDLAGSSVKGHILP